MKIVKANATVITEKDPLKRIELCGRVCYKSEGAATPDSAYGFVKRLLDKGHTSVLEHARVNVTSRSRLEQMEALLNDLEDVATAQVYAAMLSRTPETEDGFSMNVRDFLTFYPDATLDEVACMSCASEYLTVRFVCDRGIANELVRHRVFSFSQESTRYVRYADGVTFILPEPFVMPVGALRPSYYTWKLAAQNAEAAYLSMLEEGASPQEARNVLPLSTKTELIMTGTYAQWKRLFELRCARGAHPQMRVLMERLFDAEGFPAELLPSDRRGDFAI